MLVWMPYSREEENEPDATEKVCITTNLLSVHHWDDVCTKRKALLDLGDELNSLTTSEKFWYESRDYQGTARRLPKKETSPYAGYRP